MRDDGKRNLLGVQVDAVDYDGAVERVAAAARERRGLSVTALAVHGVMTGALDRDHRRRLNEFDLITPDGQPVRWALNLLHRARLRERVYGPELTLRVCERAAADGLPVFLYGCDGAMLDRLEAGLRERFPRLAVAGKRASLFRPLEDGEKRRVAEEIRASGARIVFVGLGCPRQETFVHGMRDRVGLPLLAVGAAFAFHSGDSPMAPRWMQDRGLEWFYRLSREPTRLWRRYLLLNPLYATLVAAQVLGVARFRDRDPRPGPPGAVWG